MDCRHDHLSYTLYHFTRTLSLYNVAVVIRICIVGVMIYMSVKKVLTYVSPDDRCVDSICYAY
jgi:hypothetical protein